jgi:hypothetical protein
MVMLSKYVDITSAKAAGFDSLLLGPRRVLPSWLNPNVPGRGMAHGFDLGQYWLGSGLVSQGALLADARNSDASFDNTAGVYELFGPNVPAITDRGLYAGGQFTNKNAAYNFAPSLVTPTNATAFNALAVPGTIAAHGGGGSLGQFGIVADAAKVAASSAGAISNGNVFSVDMTGDTVGSGYFIFNNAVGNTNPHSWGAWVRNDTVDATLRMVGFTSYGVVIKIPGVEYSYIKAENWTPDATAKFRPQIPFSGRLWLFGMQLVESRFLPPPIATSGAAATRLADDLTIPDFATKAAAFGFGSGFTVAPIVDITRLSNPVARTITAHGTDADNLAHVFLDTDNRVKARMRKAGADVWTIQSGVIGATGPRNIEVTFKPGANVLTVDGVAGDANADATALPALAEARIGSNFSLGTPFNDPIPRLQLWGV